MELSVLILAFIPHPPVSPLLSYHNMSNICMCKCDSFDQRGLKVVGSAVCLFSTVKDRSLPREQ